MCKGGTILVQARGKDQGMQQQNTVDRRHTNTYENEHAVCRGATCPKTVHVAQSQVNSLVTRTFQARGNRKQTNVLA